MSGKLSGFCSILTVCGIFLLLFYAVTYPHLRLCSHERCPPPVVNVYVGDVEYAPETLQQAFDEFFHEHYAMDAISTATVEDETMCERPES